MGKLEAGDLVRVEADRGFDLGTLVSSTPLSDFVALSATTTAGGARVHHDEKRLVRSATKEEVEQLAEKGQVEERAIEFIQNLCHQRAVPLVILDAEFQFDHAKV